MFAIENSLCVYAMFVFAFFRMRFSVFVTNLFLFFFFFLFLTISKLLNIINRLSAHRFKCYIFTHYLIRLYTFVVYQFPFAKPLSFPFILRQMCFSTSVFRQSWFRSQTRDRKLLVYWSDHNLAVIYCFVLCGKMETLWEKSCVCELWAIFRTEIHNDWLVCFNWREWNLDSQC